MLACYSPSPLGFRVLGGDSSVEYLVRRQTKKWERDKCIWTTWVRARASAADLHARTLTHSLNRAHTHAEMKRVNIPQTYWQTSKYTLWIQPTWCQGASNNFLHSLLWTHSHFGLECARLPVCFLKSDIMMHLISGQQKSNLSPVFAVI
jgi:hypothetical protein